MSSQEESTSPTNLNQHVAVRRETSLRRYLPPEVATSCRVLGEYLNSASLEAVGYLPEPTASDERADLRAVAVDLRLVQFYLEHIASGRLVSWLPREDRALAQLAEDSGRELSEITLRLERAVGTSHI